MPDISVAFRLVAGTNAVSDAFGEDETGLGADHVGDIITVMPIDQHWSTLERTKFGIVHVTDVPADVLGFVQSRLAEEGYMAKVMQTYPNGWAVVSNVGMRLRSPKRFRVSKVLCLAKWPAAVLKIEKVFDPTFEVPLDQIISLPWSGFRQVLVDKKTGEATTGAELEETDQ